MAGVEVGNEGIPSTSINSGASAGGVTGRIRPAGASTTMTSAPAAISGMGGKDLTASQPIMSEFKDQAGMAVIGPNVQRTRK